jgi:hypothetical protein
MSTATTHAAEHPAERPSRRPDALADDDQSQGHRHDVPDLLADHVLRRRPDDPGGARRALPARPAADEAGVLQPADRRPRAGDDFRGADAGRHRLRQLDDPADDRRPRHGAAAPQQLGLLAAAAGRYPAHPALHLALFGIGDGAIATGWTFYAPLSVQGGMGVDFAILAVHILGISSIMGSINIIVTIFNMRAPGMTMMKLPLFAWGWLITAFLLIARCRCWPAR